MEDFMRVCMCGFWLVSIFMWVFAGLVSKVDESRWERKSLYAACLAIICGIQCILYILEGK